MIDMDIYIREALIGDEELKKIIKPDNILQVYQPVNSAELPRIGIEEISDVPVYHADDVEQVVAVSYRLLIYSENQLSLLVNEVNRIMQEIGFMRKSKNKLYELPQNQRGIELIYIKGELL